MTLGFQHRKLVAGGFHTSVVLAGTVDAPPVLLLHDGAWGGSALASWSRVIPLLSQNHFVGAPDMLGFGDTEKVVKLGQPTHGFRADHIGAVLHALGITKPVHLVGTSFGGSVALHAAAKAVFPIASVMSIAGTGGGWRTPFGAKELPHWDGTRDDLERVVRCLCDDYAEFEEDLELRLEMGSRPGHHQAMSAPAVTPPAALAPQKRRRSWPRHAAAITSPTLLVRPTRDRILESGWAEELARHSRAVEIADIDGQHSPNLDRADLVADLVSVFVAANAGKGILNG